MTKATNTTRYHRGELRVQSRAGVTERAARLEGMLAPAHLDGRIAQFLAEREFAVLTGRDRSGRLWISPLVGRAGFLGATGTTLTVRAGLAEGDPLASPPPGQHVGLLTIDFALRRRVRINGTLSAVGPEELNIDADQAYGNCPSYIQQRHLHADLDRSRSEPPASESGTALTSSQEALIRSADTFFLGTEHPAYGADASHKGGPPGFVRVVGPELWWPDYAGNNMFNSMGNIAVNPEAALLLVDFRTGATLHLSGRAKLEWSEPGGPGDDGNTGRRVRFRLERTATSAPQPARSNGVRYSEHNPTLRPS